MRDDSRTDISQSDFRGEGSEPSFLSRSLKDMMARVQGWFRRSPSYQPLLEDSEGQDEQHVAAHGSVFSWIDYLVFMLVGVSMLWAW